MKQLNEIRRLAGLPLKENDTNALDKKVERIIAEVQRLCDKHGVQSDDLDDDLADLSNEIHNILAE